jgi:hypothetical protein
MRQEKEPSHVYTHIDPAETWEGIIMECKTPQKGEIGKVVLSPAKFIPSKGRLTPQARRTYSKLSRHPHNRDICMRVSFLLKYERYKQHCYFPPLMGTLLRVKCITDKNGRKWVESATQDERINLWNKFNPPEEYSH